MKALSLFTGIGGADLAAEAAGIEVIAMSEIDPYCCKVLAKHWPHIPNLGNVRNIKGGDIGAIDLIFGGFPCQPWSTAGKRRGAADDRHLWPEMLRLVHELKPTWVVGENVVGFVHLGLDSALSDLEAEGYECRAFVLPACAVGALHSRDRCFIVAHSADSRHIERSQALNKASRQHKVRVGECPKNVADTNGRVQSQETQVRIEPFRRPGDNAQATTDAQGFRVQGSGSRPPPSWLDATRLSEVPPLVQGRLKDRASRIKALGNAIVPQQIYPIFKAILAIKEEQ